MTRGNAAANHLELDSIYEDLFSKENVQSTFQSECDALKKYDSRNGNVRKLCNKLVYFLEEIAKIDDENTRYDRCAYLTHWLYDKIGGIHNKNTTNINNIDFATDIIKVGQDVSKKITGNKCNLGHDVGVSLKNLKERKMLFTYFKKFESIKTRMENMKQGECDIYAAYINDITSVYKTYKNKICHKFLSSSSIPDYFDCNENYDPSSLLPLVEPCKSIAPRTPARIAHRTSEEYTEVEDSVSEDEAGSGPDDVEHDAGSESGDEEDEYEEAEFEEAEFEEDEFEEDEDGGYYFRNYFVPRDRRGRTNVELPRRRVPGSRELEKKQKNRRYKRDEI